MCLFTGVSTVRRSYFIPRLGKRQSYDTNNSENKQELTPAEEEFLQELFSRSLEDAYRQLHDEEDPEEDTTAIMKRAFSFSPRLGKRAFTFSPRLGKKAFSFSPRLGKREYSFMPRLGKKSFTFSPRLGKRQFSFSPRLG